MTATEIYDGKPSMSKTRRVADPSTGVIRTSVCESVTHPDQLLSVHTLVQPYWKNNTATRTHKFSYLQSRIQP